MAKTAIRKPGEGATLPTRYEDDLYTWVEEQVALLRAGRPGEVDAHNVAEELADVCRSEFNSLRNSIAVLVQHLLKWDHQPGRRTRSWQLSVREHRIELEQVLRDSPGLKTRIAEAIEQGYRLGRIRALKETRFEEADLPEVCPYTFDERMTRPVSMSRLPSAANPPVGEHCITLVP